MKVDLKDLLPYVRNIEQRQCSDIRCYALYTRIFKSKRKGNAPHAPSHACLAGLAMKQSGGTITLLHTLSQNATATDSPLKFPWFNITQSTILP